MLPCCLCSPHTALPLPQPRGHRQPPSGALPHCKCFLPAQASRPTRSVSCRNRPSASPCGTLSPPGSWELTLRASSPFPGPRPAFLPRQRPHLGPRLQPAHSRGTHSIWNFLVPGFPHQVLSLVQVVYLNPPALPWGHGGTHPAAFPGGSERATDSYFLGCGIFVQPIYYLRLSSCEKRVCSPSRAFACGRGRHLLLASLLLQTFFLSFAFYFPLSLFSFHSPLCLEELIINRLCQTTFANGPQHLSHLCSIFFLHIKS